MILLSNVGYWLINILHITAGLLFYQYYMLLCEKNNVNQTIGYPKHHPLPPNYYGLKRLCSVSHTKCHHSFHKLSITQQSSSHNSLLQNSLTSILEKHSLLKNLYEKLYETLFIYTIPHLTLNLIAIYSAFTKEKVINKVS